MSTAAVLVLDVQTIPRLRGQVVMVDLGAAPRLEGKHWLQRGETVWSIRQRVPVHVLDGGSKWLAMLVDQHPPVERGDVLDAI